MKLSVNGKTVAVPPSDLGLTFDSAVTVDAVRSSRFNPLDLIFAHGVPTQVRSTVNAQALNNYVAALGQRYEQDVTEPSITFVGVTAQVVNGSAGQTIDQIGTQAAILSRYPTADTIVVPTQTRNPTVSNTDAQSFADGSAHTAVAEPIVVKAGTESATANPTDIAMSLNYQVRDGRLQPVVDGAMLHERVVNQLKAVDKRAVDASWDVSTGVPVVKPAKPGYGVTDENVASSVAGVLDKTGVDRTVTVALGPIQPRLTTEAAQALGITEKMGSFTQRFPYADYRFHNINEASKKINKSLILPGAVFSMNDTVGERTAANGFVKGPVVGEGGKLHEDFGGGVSTAATTVWTAAFYSGLESVEHGSHLIWISRYQPGLEATVAWGQLDLKLRNNTSTGVYITTVMKGQSLKVSIWGKKQYDSIKAVSGKRTNVTKYAVATDSSAACFPQAGVDGFDIQVTREFIKGGAVVNREPFNTHYIPAPNVVCVPAPKAKSPSQASGAGSTASQSTSQSPVSH